MEMRPADTLEVQLLCNCCRQPYYPNKSWEDRIQAIIFGAEEYVICPLCTQEVPKEILSDAGYRARCHYKIERLRDCSEQTAQLTRMRPTPKPSRAMRN